MRIQYDDVKSEFGSNEIDWRNQIRVVGDDNCGLNVATERIQKQI